MESKDIPLAEKAAVKHHEVTNSLYLPVCFVDTDVTLWRCRMLLEDVTWHRARVPVPFLEDSDAGMHLL